jgi:hypothetical protein
VKCFDLRGLNSWKTLNCAGIETETFADSTGQLDLRA